ncbi:hypothetical protein Psi02_23780 [Planotetraspora silvatica]|uniref:Glycosyltransferase 2-like domain-containing protein n=1 Tax=Planotetraspora silvatica TaxID=234614 RepID=A0A8J3UHT3_9ACTN|nr:glycosyltransferase [Planotetraspora silvatica]GII45954.1 hypothetical protein Psi02_23780 [Planotetraspora silvatica]
MISPKGFLRASGTSMAEARWDGSQWIVASTPVPQGLTETDVDGLRNLLGVRVLWPSSAVPLDVILQLAAAGIPLHSSVVPRWLADDPLGALVLDGRWLEPEKDSSGVSIAELRREEHSVRLRRHGLRRTDHSRRPGSVSVILPSRRPWMAAFALKQIAQQRDVDLEVVYAAHGFPADAVREAAREFPFPIEIMEIDGETVFGDVLNTAIERAGGDYVAKWDDDDWYGQDHLSDLLLAKAYSGADLVGMSAEFFYLEPLNVTIRRAKFISEITTNLVAGGTIMMERTALKELGGFRPLPRAVDSALLATVGESGGTVYRTHGLGYMLLRGLTEQHTWLQPLSQFLRSSANQWRGFRPTQILEGS